MRLHRGVKIRGAFLGGTEEAILWILSERTGALDSKV